MPPRLLGRTSFCESLIDRGTVPIKPGQFANLTPIYIVPTFEYCAWKAAKYQPVTYLKK